MNTNSNRPEAGAQNITANNISNTSSFTNINEYWNPYPGNYWWPPYTPHIPYIPTPYIPVQPMIIYNNPIPSYTLNTLDKNPEVHILLNKNRLKKNKVDGTPQTFQ